MFLFYVQELNIANILVILYFSCRIIAGSGWSTNQPSPTTRPVAMSVGTRCRQLDPPKMVVASCDGGNLFKIAETLNNNVFAACEHVFSFCSQILCCFESKTVLYKSCSAEHFVWIDILLRRATSIYQSLNVLQLPEGKCM